MDKKQELKPTYDALVKTIFYKGECFPKKHGHWYRLKMAFDPTFSLVMDSWNHAIWLMENAEYEPNGELDGSFDGKKIKYFGIDFGGFELHVEKRYLELILEKAQAS